MKVYRSQGEFVQDKDPLTPEARDFIFGSALVSVKRRGVLDESDRLSSALIKDLEKLSPDMRLIVVTGAFVGIYLQLLDNEMRRIL